MKVKVTIACLIFAILIAIAPSSGTLLIEQDWVKYARNPVFDTGPAGSWEDTHITPIVYSH